MDIRTNSFDPELSLVVIVMLVKDMSRNKLGH